MSKEEFEVHKKAIEARKLEKPKTLDEQTEVYWKEISTRRYNFDREKLEVQHLNFLTKDNILDFYNVSSLSIYSKRASVRECYNRCVPGRKGREPAERKGECL